MKSTTSSACPAMRHESRELTHQRRSPWHASPHTTACSGCPYSHYESGLTCDTSGALVHLTNHCAEVGDVAVHGVVACAVVACPVPKCRHVVVAVVVAEAVCILAEASVDRDTLNSAASAVGAVSAGAASAQGRPMHEADAETRATRRAIAWHTFCPPQMALTNFRRTSKMPMTVGRNDRESGQVAKRGAGRSPAAPAIQGASAPDQFVRSARKVATGEFAGERAKSVRTWPLSRLAP